MPALLTPQTQWPALVTEALTKADHECTFLLTDLRDANQWATPTEHLLLLPLIGEAERIRQQVAALLNAREQTQP